MTAANDAYFQELGQVLKQHGAHYPTLVVDKQKLDHNIDLLMKTINQGFHYRIVAKSLPSIPLLQYIMKRTGSNRLMSFHLPFLQSIARHMPSADVLMGKPMPVAGVKHFYQWCQQQRNVCFNPARQLQWLVDSLERLQDYRQFAEQQQLHLRINLEIDVGLHRGGFQQPELFVQALERIQQSPNLELSGLMGYEAHVTKIPGILGGPNAAFDKAMEAYRLFVDLVRQTLGPNSLDGLCLNAGGSTTYPLYQHPGLINEIATASALVKPTDFDVYTLDQHEPAAFIATPILKDVRNPAIPMASALSSVLRMTGQLPRRACFIYGGNWLAQPCYPQNSKRANILGHSSNQELYEIPASSPLKREDFFFFRPTQSESVFLQFGDIAVYDQGNIGQHWPVFSYPSEETSTHVASHVAEVHQLHP